MSTSTSTSLLRRTAKRSKVNLETNEARTPPMTRPRSSSMDSFDEDYYSKTYVPLSNLPTPPLSSHSNASSRQMSSEVLFSPTEYLDPQLLGPAIHFTNLIPAPASLTPASTSLVHALLTRASLPLEIIALAVSILDSLNPRFALQYRISCPTTPSQHIDDMHPELIPLCALILAHKFADDAELSTRDYVDNWGRGMWTCGQINQTQWCLMDNLGGRLFALWHERVILGALEDMERAGRGAMKGISRVLEEEWEMVALPNTSGVAQENSKSGGQWNVVQERRVIRAGAKEPFPSFGPEMARGC